MEDGAASTPDGPAPDARPRGPDRRQRPTPMFSRYLFIGRRRGGRRAGERDYIYVDRPDRWTVLAFFVVVVLSGLDAWYTLNLVDDGKAIEANPIMAAALHMGREFFVWIKTLMTCLAAAFLCVHRNWPLGRVCLTVAIAGYGTLVIYHLFAQHAAAQIPAFPR